MRSLSAGHQSVRLYGVRASLLQVDHLAAVLTLVLSGNARGRSQDKGGDERDEARCQRLWALREGAIARRAVPPLWQMRARASSATANKRSAASQAEAKFGQSNDDEDADDGSEDDDDEDDEDTYVVDRILSSRKAKEGKTELPCIAWWRQLRRQ